MYEKNRLREKSISSKLSDLVSAIKTLAVQSTSYDAAHLAEYLLLNVTDAVVFGGGGFSGRSGAPKHDRDNHAARDTHTHTQTGKLGRAIRQIPAKATQMLFVLFTELYPNFSESVGGSAMLQYMDVDSELDTIKSSFSQDDTQLDNLNTIFQINLHPNVLHYAAASAARSLMTQQHQQQQHHQQQHHYHHHQQQQQQQQQLQQQPQQLQQTHTQGGQNSHSMVRESTRKCIASCSADSIVSDDVMSQCDDQSMSETVHEEDEKEERESEQTAANEEAAFSLSKEKICVSKDNDSAVASMEDFLEEKAAEEYDEYCGEQDANDAGALRNTQPAPAQTHSQSHTPSLTQSHSQSHSQSHTPSQNIRLSQLPRLRIVPLSSLAASLSSAGALQPITQLNQLDLPPPTNIAQHTHSFTAHEQTQSSQQQQQQQQQQQPMSEESAEFRIDDIESVSSDENQQDEEGGARSANGVAGEPEDDDAALAQITQEIMRLDGGGRTAHHSRKQPALKRDEPTEMTTLSDREFDEDESEDDDAQDELEYDESELEIEAKSPTNYRRSGNKNKRGGRGGGGAGGGMTSSSSECNSVLSKPELNDKKLIESSKIPYSYWDIINSSNSSFTQMRANPRLSHEQVEIIVTVRRRSTNRKAATKCRQQKQSQKAGLEQRVAELRRTRLQLEDKCAELGRYQDFMKAALSESETAILANLRHPITGAGLPPPLSQWQIGYVFDERHRPIKLYCMRVPTDSPTHTHTHSHAAAARHQRRH